MNNLTTFYNDFTDNSDNTFLYFKLAGNNYAVKVPQVVEIIKLPLLDYPQKLVNNIVGLLKYNEFTINILDLRFYLGLNVTEYTTSNQILIVKTDETIFGLIIDKAIDIFSPDSSKTEIFSSVESNKLIESICKKDDETVSIIDLNVLESILKQGFSNSEIDIPSLFPKDDDSQWEFKQRSLMLQAKNFDLSADLLSQNKFISFTLNSNLYCLDLKYVQEFLKNVSITKMPCNYDYISGIISQKGEFITIIKIANLISEAEIEINENYCERNNIIILDCIEYKIGILVDKIESIVSIPEELIEKDTKNSPKYILSEIRFEDKFYTILNMNSILSDERLFINETV